MKAKQPLLRLSTHGGARPGAGRPKTNGSGVAHRARKEIDARYPAHVTLKLLAGVRSLRSPALLPVLEAAFAEGCRQEGFRVVHYSIQSDHIHLVVEADDSGSLGRGMQGLGIRIARRLNAALGRTGRLFGDRYHARVLRTPKEVRVVLNYVLNNAMLHARRAGGTAPTFVDPYSSGRFFDGWRDVEHVPHVAPGSLRTVARPRSWLLRVGWRRHGLLSTGDW